MRLIYKAFISYSHAADGKLAPALQSSLQRFAKPWNQLRAMRVFVDTASLSANPALWPTIEEALRESEYFVLMASPSSAQSFWVRKEIELWTGLGRVRQLLIVLTDGEIGWSVDEQALDGARTTALPDTLRAVMRDEPLYTDLRWVRTEGHLSLQDPRFTDAVASLAATIRGMSKDDLYGEHVSQHQRLVRLRRLAVSGLALLAVAALAAALVAFGQRNEARRQAQIALGRQLAAQAETARAQRSQLLPYSLLLGVESMRAFPSVEADQAIRGALARLPALVQVTQQPDAVEEMAIHPGTGRVAAATSTGVVALWGTGEPERRLTETRKNSSPIVFSRDGRFLATIDRDQSVRLWDADTGREAYPPFRLMGQTLRLAFSPDTRMLAATSLAGSASGVSVWDLATGSLLRHLPLERGAEGSQGLAISADGRLAAVDYSRVRIWDTGSWRELARPDMPNASIADLRFSPDGRSLVVGSSTGKLWIWEAGQTRPRATFEVRAPRNIVFGGNGAFMAASVGGNKATVWETANWTEIASVTHEGEITSIAFNASGTVLATGGVDGTAALWSVATGMKLIAMDHGDRVVGVAFPADQGRVVTASADGTVRTWETHADVELAVLTGGADESQTMFDARGGRFLKIAGGDSLSIWREGQSAGRLSLPEHRRSAALSPNGERAAVAGAGDVVRIWDVGAQRETMSLPHPGEVDWKEYGRRVGFKRDFQAESIQKQMSETQGAVDLFGFSADGRYLLTTRRDFVARIWDVASGRLVASQPYQTTMTAAAFSPDGRFAAMILDGKELLVVGLPDARRIFSTRADDFVSVAISTTGVVAVVEQVQFGHLRVLLWRSSDWSSLPTIAFESRQSDVALSRNGEFVGLTGDDDMARVFRTASGTEVARFAVSGSAIPVFSADSTLVAVAGAGQAVHVLELSRNREGAPLAHNEDTPLIAFTPDSHYLATAGATFTRVFSAATGEEVARIGNPVPVERIQFSPDGRYMATTDGANSRIWSWTSGDVAGAACRRLRRQVRESQWPRAAGERFDVRLARACPAQ